MTRSTFFFICFLTLAALHGIHAVEYLVINNATTTRGGIRFTNELGADYTKDRMAAASEFIWRILQQNTPEERINRPQVIFFVDQESQYIAYVINNEVHFHDDYIENIKGDIKWDFNGVLFHEMSHIWQNGVGKAPGGVIEGIADYVRLKANYIPAHWVKAGGGDRWDQGYDVTARFLDYCNGLRNGFVAELNKKMKDAYNDSYFVDLLGKNVNQLWTDYKAKFPN
ncbi:hypothetical protein EZV62_011216 [Acer yangbiense]|uniref:Plant basic secretory protein (BSP) family protein n=1 Tax=Acer yangbiense TaxID=1000413 RepID=A0A5C7I6N1_9ROSI|nr:hypothetical protein Q3G72_019125 [Acer saccharum]TXG64222.1 hypothetical protein EZV62_011216 [Acer yangbiense]